jgi:hypothetical protein
VTRVAEYVNSRFEPEIRLRVEKPIIDGSPLLVVVVNEFDDQPHVCIKEGRCSNETAQFLPGHLLIRSAAAQTKVVDATELRELLGRAVSRKREHLLEQMRRIVSGTPTPPRSRDVQELFQPELRDWESIVAEASQRSPYGGWSFVTMPGRKAADPLSHGLLRAAMDRASFDFRGWGFPAVPVSEIANRASGISGEAKFDGFIERWHLFRHALFADFRSFWEDSLWLTPGGTPGTELSFVNVTYTVAEYVLFSKRLFNELAYEGEAVLLVRLLGCEGRKLVSKQWHRMLYGLKQSREKEIPVARTVHTTELAAGWEECAADIVQDIFALFNWSNSDRRMILDDIVRLRERRT